MCLTEEAMVTLREEVEALSAAYSKVVANQDVAAVAELYASDARLLPPGSPMLEGLDAIRSFFKLMFDAGVRSLDLESVVVDGREDLAIDVGRYRVTMEPPGADPMVEVGKYLVVLKRQPDGVLRMVYDAYNSDQPPSG
jgi:uncharacterized protein (TIGR02246 family)